LKFENHQSSCSKMLPHNSCTAPLTMAYHELHLPFRVADFNSKMFSEKP
jgi:hypothetical protein